MLKELWILLRMLFVSKPENFEKVVWMEMQHFPFRGYVCMMWCGRIIFRKGEIGLLSYKQVELVCNHENIHLAQAKICGSWVKYYWRYFIGWLKYGYRNNPYEREAYGDGDNLKTQEK